VLKCQTHHIQNVNNPPQTPIPKQKQLNKKTNQPHITQHLNKSNNPLFLPKNYLKPLKTKAV